MSSQVWVEVVQGQPSSGRPIGPRHRVSELLLERKPDIEAAVVKMSEILAASASAAKDAGKWEVSSLEFTFGITLSAEAGVVISRFGTEASFEVKMSIEPRKREVD